MSAGEEHHWLRGVKLVFSGVGLKHRAVGCISCCLVQGWVFFPLPLRRLIVVLSSVRFFDI